MYYFRKEFMIVLYPVGFFLSFIFKTLIQLINSNNLCSQGGVRNQGSRYRKLTPLS